ncbi:MAG: UPF0280 family protein [Candidatus Aerophobetes bacterium]|nr:UPF0280 family protein [Candidatus Aerophobetes bacterium]
MDKKAIYRDLIKPGSLSSFQISIKESDLLILADKKLPREAEEALLWCRKDIEQYIYQNPIFKTSFKPLPLEEKMLPIVRAMIEASQKAGVGPMAAVAGAIAEFVGKKLLNHCHEVIVENGGDIFMEVKRRKKVGIYAGESPLSGKIALEVESQDTPLGLCCSAGTFGHSLSLGEADAVVILSPCAALADAVATAVGNIMKKKNDIQKGLEFLRKIPEVQGGVIIKVNRIGAWGKVRIVGM